MAKQTVPETPTTPDNTQSGSWLKNVWARMTVADTAADEVISELANPVAAAFLRRYAWLLQDKYELAVKAITRVPTLVRLGTGGHPLLAFAGMAIQRLGQEVRERWITLQSEGFPTAPAAGGPAVTPAPVVTPDVIEEMVSDFETSSRILQAVSFVENNRQRKGFLRWYNNIDEPDRVKLNRTIAGVTESSLMWIVRMSVTELDLYVASLPKTPQPEARWENVIQMKKEIRESGDTSLVFNLVSFETHLEHLNPEHTDQNRIAFWDAALARTPNLPRFKEVMELMEGPLPQPEQIVRFYGLTPKKPETSPNQTLEFIKTLFTRVDQPIDREDPRLKHSEQFVENSRTRLAATWAQFKKDTGDEVTTT